MAEQPILIVGAGPGGLAAAMLLAAADLPVTVIERRDRVGGRTSAIEADGFRFDLGPTFFLYPQVLEDIFRASGRELQQEVDLRRLDPQYRIGFGAGGHLDCSPDVAAMERQIAALAPGDERQFQRFLNDNRHKLALFAPCLEMPYEGLGDLLNLRMMKLLPVLQPTRSVDQYLRGYFADPRIRLAFSFQSKYLGMSPFQCPSLFSILSFLEYEFGVYHPVGGCSQLSETMADIAVAMGVDLRLGERVTGIELSSGRATGVVTETGSYPAAAVVLNADFAHAMGELLPNSARRRWSDQALARKRYSCSTFMLYLGIEGCYDHLLHHNIQISSDYERNLDEVENQHVLSDDPSFYIQNACVTDPSLAPDGCSTLYVLAPVTHQHPNVDWAVEMPRFRDRLLDAVAGLGLEDLRSRIRFERVVTPDDWADQAFIYRGATFNLAHNLGQMLHLRPHNRFEDVAGLYLVGGGTHPGSGLPVIYESAKIASRLLCEDLGVAAPWRDGLFGQGVRPFEHLPHGV